MTSYSWNGGSGGWGTIANWTGGIPNSTTADAAIAASGAYTVTVEAGKTYTVDSVNVSDSTALLDVAGTLKLGGTLALLTLSTGTLELAGVISGGTIDLEGGSTLLAAGGALTGVSAFTLGGSANIDLNNQSLAIGGSALLQGYVYGGGDLVLTGSAVLTDNVYFETGVTLVDTGTVNMASNINLAVGGAAATLLTIAAGGTFDVTAVDSQIGNSGTAYIQNAGLFENVSTVASYVNVYENFTNSSTGTIYVAANADVSLIGGGTNDLAGKITGPGDIYIANGVTTLEAGLSLNAGVLSLEGGGTTVILESSRNIGNVFNDDVNVGLDLNGHVLTASSTGFIRSYVYGGGTVEVTGSFDVGGLYLGSGTEELVTGTAIVDQYSNQLNYDNGTAASLLSIASTGTYDITEIDGQINSNGTAVMNNAGLFENVVSLASYSYQNDYSYFNDYVNFTQTGTGTLYVGTADDISLLGATNALAGTITGAGDLYLGGGTTTLEAGLVLNNGRYLTASGGNVILEGNRAFAQQFEEINGANLQLNGSTLTLDGTGSLGAYITGPGVLDVTGTYFVGGLQLGSGVTETLSGVEIQNGETQFEYDNGTAAAVLSITATGIYDITADSNIDNRNAGGSIVNAGLFEKTGYDSYTNMYTGFTNTGSGTIAISAGTDISFLGATNSIAGTVTGGGDIYFGNASDTTLQAGLVIEPSLLYVTASDGGTQLNLASSRSFGATFTDQNSADVLLNGNTLTATGTSSFYNAYLSGPGELIISGSSDFDGINVIGSATILDKGTIIQDGYDELGTNGTANVVLSIASGAVYNIVNDSYINPQGTSAIDNAGLFEKTGGTGISDIYAPLNNLAGGTISVATGELRLDNGGTLAGTLAGAGILDLNGGIFTLASGLVLNPASFYQTGGEIFLESSRSYTGAAVFQNGTLALNGFNLALNNPGDDLSNGDLYGTGTLSEAGRADINNFNLTGSAELLDLGTITEDGSYNLGLSGSDNAVLSIASNGIYDIVNDSYIYAQGTAAIDNAGLFEKTAATGPSNIYATFNDAATGTLAADSGYIQLLSGGSLAGTLTGPGNLYLASGTFGLAAAAVVNIATLNVNGGQLNLLGARSFTDVFNETSGDLNLNGFAATLTGLDHLDGAYLSGPGTLDITGTTELANYYVTGINDTLQVAGTIIADGNLILSNAATDVAVLTISSGAIYDIINDSYIYTNGTAAIDNAGLFEKTAANGASNIYSVFNNAASGTLAVNTGYIQLLAGGSLAGSLTGAGNLFLGSGTFGLASSAVVNIATLNVNGGQLNLLGARNFTTMFNETGGELDLNGFSATLAGTDRLVNSYLSGPGTLSVTGTSDIGGYNLTGGAVLLDAGTITMDGNLQLGESGADSASLSIVSGATYNILNDSYIYETGTVAVQNAGLFEKTGASTSRSYVQGSFINSGTGTIALTAGILEIQGLVNNGLATIANGLLQTDNTLTGTGKIVLGGNATLLELGGIAATETIAMTGTNDQVQIGNGSNFAGTITGFAAGDVIDLQNTIANGFNYVSNRLTLTENGAAVTTLALPGIANAGSLSLTPDGNNGTFIEFGSPGTITQPGGGIIQDNWTVASGNFNTGADWSNGVPGTLSNAYFNSGLGAISVTDSASTKIYSLEGNDSSAIFAQSAGTLTVIDGGNWNGVFDQTAGEILVQSGDLALNNSGTLAGTLAGAGSISVGASGGIMTLAASAVLGIANFGLNYNSTLALENNRTYAGTFSSNDYSTIALDGFNLSLSGATNFNYGDFIDGTGTLIVSGPTQLYNFAVAEAAVLDITGTAVQLSNLSIGNGGADTAAVSIASTGTLNIEADSNVYGEGAASLVNAGLLEKTGDFGPTYIQSINFTNASTGIVNATRGVLLFNADNAYVGGTLTGAGEIEFASSNVTLAPTVALNSGGLLLAASNFFLGSSETYAGTFGMQSGGTLELGASNLTLTGSASLGGVYVGGSGTLKVTGQTEMTGAQLLNSTTLLDAGTIVEDGGFALGYYATDSNVLIVSAGDVFNIITDNSIGASGTASIYNAGLFEKTADFGNSYIAPSFTNASTGTIDVASGQLLLQSGGTLNGTITGAGELYLQNNGGTLTLGAAAVLTVATLNANETLLLAGSNHYAGVFADTNNLELNGFNLTLTGSAALDSYLQGPGTLTVAGPADVSGLYMYGNAVLADKGTITQDGGFTMGNISTDAPLLSIAGGAVYDILTDNAINNNGNAVINNAGLFEKTGDYGTSYIYSSFTNSSTGTIDAARGFLNFQNGGIFNGTLAGGQDGTIADGGIIFGNGLATLGAAAVVSVAELGLTGGTLALGGNLNYAGYFDGTGGALDLNGHTLTLNSPNLDFVLAGPGTLDVTGTANFGLNVTGGAVVVDYGTLLYQGLQLGDLTGDSAELSIASSGVFNIAIDNVYLGADGNAAIVNSGLFEKTAGTGYTQVDPSFTNTATGIINVTRGDLGFIGGGIIGGTLTGAGEIQLNGSGDVLTSSIVNVATLGIYADPTLATNLSYGGFFYLSYSDTFTLGSHALLLSGTADLIGGFEGPGAVTVTGSAIVQTADLYGGSTLIDAGTISQIDELRFSLNDNTADVLSITSAGTYDIQNDSDFRNFNNGSNAENVFNAGLLEKTGDTGLSELEVTLSNTGTVLVTSGTLQIDATSNLNAGTLAGGSWIADTGFLGPILSIAGGTIAVDAASVTLSGADSELIAGGTIIEQSLVSIAATGLLAIDAARGYASANALTDAGKILLAAGTFSAPALTIAAGGSFAGYGTLAGAVADNGLISATQSTLTIESNVTGSGTMLIAPGAELILGAGAASGTNIDFGGSHAVLGLVSPGAVQGTLVSLAPSDTIDLIGTVATAASIAGNKLVVTLASGGTISYALAAATPGTRVAINSDGHGGSDLSIFREAVPSAVSPTPVNFGQHHSAFPDVETYTITNSVLVDPYSENLNASMGATTGAVTDSGTISGLAPGATNSTALHATLAAANGGVVSGTATVNLATTGSGVNGDGGGTIVLPSETVALSGTFFNFATASLAPTSAAFGQHHVGDTLTKSFTVANTALPGIYSENLDASFSGTSTNIAANGSIAELAAGATNSSALALTLNSGTAGVQSGATTLNLTSDGTGIDSLGTTALNSDTIAVTGTLFNYATASAEPGTLSFGQAHVGAALVHTLSLANTAAPGIYSENLDGSFSGTSASLATSGSASELAAGSTAALILTLNSATAGVQSGATTLNLTSDGAGIDSLGTTALGTDTIAATGTLFNEATASAQPGTISFGIVHVGQSVSQFLTLTNTASPGIYSENLDGGFSGTSASVTTTGTISELAAGGTSSALDVSLQTSKAGTISGFTTLNLTSDGTGIDSLGTTALGADTIAVTGTVNHYATVGVALLSGPGALSAGAGGVLKLNLGTVTQNSTGPAESIGIVNSAVGPADLLKGNLSLSGTTSAFTNNSAISFTGLAAGGTSTGHTISLHTNTVGTFTETIVLSPTGYNASGYAGALAPDTLVVTGTVTAAQAAPHAMAFLAPAPAPAPALTPAPRDTTPLTGLAAWLHLPDLRAAPAAGFAAASHAVLATAAPPVQAIPTASGAGLLTPLLYHNPQAAQAALLGRTG